MITHWLWICLFNTGFTSTLKSTEIQIKNKYLILEEEEEKNYYYEYYILFLAIDPFKSHRLDI